MLANAASTRASAARAATPARPIAVVAPRRARAGALVVRADAAVADSSAKSTSGVEKSVPSLKAVLDIEAIKGILPHR